MSRLARGERARCLYDGIMKTSMKVLVGAVALIAMIAGGRVATAGYKGIPHPVAVDTSARSAWGTFADVRNSDDSVQYMTIFIGASSYATTAVATFVDEHGVMGSCTTTDPKMVAALQSVKSDSFVWVMWTSQGQCTSVLQTLSTQNSTN